MAKQLNQVKVNLAFTADTSQAKASLQSLKNDLTSLTNLSAVPMHLPITDKMAEASRAAASLKVQLEQATNVNTGKLDLTKFSTSLKQSGLDLEYYRKQLQTLGPQGQKAFLNLASAIQQAEAPLFSINGILKQMGTTLSNTIRWQISSSAIHAFVGGIQTAFGYAEDLNESLNNIRIVTGQSTEQMAEFAKEANKAAKALSTTTTDYTDAALIYYQQGLNNQEVKARTDITVKMANVSRQSAEEVSDQLTAVWNNFYDGSQSLEHYADAMTKLGADTASSSDEIAQGLEKFAAIGDTIGLSFDNAAAALATVTATTRQSADVVGTAFKTIFARIQGLNLGETLDDGTTLNKYSEALSKIGISIFESNGNLKDMDNILAEMGEKWKGLNEDQKTALAQTVAGVRQYTQLIALMDNFDFYEKNLLSAQNADGTLQEQADIYAESWEASSDRVKAAAETIYSALINDKFFISLNDNLAEVLENIGKFIDKLGGAKGIFLTVGMLLTRFADQAIANGIRNIALNIGNVVTHGKLANDMRQKAVDQVKAMAASNKITQTEALSYERIAQSQDLLLKNNNKMSDIEKQIVANMLDQQKIAAENLQLAEQELLIKKKIFDISKTTSFNTNFKDDLAASGIDDNFVYKGQGIKLKAQTDAYRQLVQQMSVYSQELLKVQNVENIDSNLKKKIIKLLKTLGIAYDGEKIKLDNFNKMMTNETVIGDLLGQAFLEVTTNLETYGNACSENEKEVKRHVEALIKQCNTLDENSNVISILIREFNKLNQSSKNIDTFINESKGPFKDWANTLTRASGTIMNITMAITQLKSAADTVRSPDASDWDKFSSVLMAISFTIPAITEGFDLLSSAITGLSAALRSLGISKMMANIYVFAAIAALALLAVGITKLVGKYKQLETENKQAAEDLKNTKQAFDDVNNSISETQSLLDGLGDRYSNIQELEYGTSKWRDAVSDLNGDLTDTLEKYDLLNNKSAWYRDSQGVMHLTDVGRQAIASKMDTEKQAMNAALSSAEGRKRETQLAVDIEDLSREYGYKVNTNFTALGAYSGNTSNNVYSSDLSKNDIQQLINAQLKDTSFDITNATDLESIGLDEKTIELITSNDELRQEIINLTNATKSAAEAYEVDVANDLISAGLDLSSIADEYKEGVLSAISEDTVEKKNAYKDEILNDTSKIGGKEADQWVQEYLDYHGYSGNAKKDNDKDWNTLTTFKLDENGNQTEEKITIDKDSIAEWAALTAAEMEALDLGVEGYQALVNRSEQAWTASDNLNKEGNQLVQDFNTLSKLQDPYLNTGEKETLRSVASSYTENFEANRQDIADLVGVDVNSETLDDTFGNVEWVLENIQDIQDALNGDAEALNRIRGEVRKTDKAIIENAKSWYDNAGGVHAYIEALEDGEEISDDAITQLQESLSASADELSTIANVAPNTFKDFIKDTNYATESAQLFKKIADGDIQALTDLKDLTSDKIIADIVIGQDDQIKTDVNNLHSELQAALLDPVSLNVDINSEEFLSKCNEMIAAADMTAADVKKYFGSMGYNADIEMTTVESEPTVRTQDVLEPTGEVVDGIHLFEVKTHELFTKAPPLSVPTVKTLTADGTEFGGDFKVTERNVNAGKDSENGDGGGTGDAPKTHDTKKLRDEVDRYRVITARIKDQTAELDRLSKAKDRAFGTSRLGLMDAEAAALQKQIELQQAYIAEIQQYTEEDAAELIAAANSFGINVNFENGIITNYDEVMAQAVAKYNSMANSLMTDDAFEASAEEPYERLMEAMDMYEETYDTLTEAQAELIDFQNQLADLALEKIQYKVELKIEVNDSELEFLDYVLFKIEDDAYKTAEAIALLGEKTSSTLDKIKAYEDGITEILKSKGLTIEDLATMSTEDLVAKGFTNDEIQSLKDYKSSILEANTELLELRTTVQEQVLNSFESLNEEVEYQSELFDHYTEVLSTTKNIVDLLGVQLGDSSKTLIKTINKSIANASLLDLKNKKLVADNLKKEYALVEQAYAEALAANDTVAIEQWKNTLKTLETEIKAAELNALNTWKQAISQAHELFSEAIELIGKDFEKAMSPIYGTLDAMSAAFERATDLSDNYLTDYEKLYELTKLNREIAGSIEDTDIVNNKKALAKLQEEINKKQADGVQLSQYDLNVLRKKYELELARQNLEEAKNAKSIVSLTKDSEGNWGYLYTADQDEIAKAEQSYEDKLKEMQDLNADYIQSLSEEILSLQEEVKNALQEVWNDTTLSAEEKEIQTANIMNWFNEENEMLSSQLEGALKNQQETTKLINSYHNTNLDILDTFKETSLAQVSSLGSISELALKSTQAVDDMLEELRLAQIDLESSIADLNQAMGVNSPEDLGETLETIVDSSNIELEKVSNELTELSNNAVSVFQDVLTAAINFEKTYGNILDDAITKNEKLVLSINEMIASLSGVEGSFNIDDSLLGDLNLLDNVNITQHLEGINEPINSINNFNSINQVNEEDRNNLIKELSNNIIKMNSSDFESQSDYYNSLKSNYKLTSALYEEALKELDIYNMRIWDEVLINLNNKIHDSEETMFASWKDLMNVNNNSSQGDIEIINQYEETLKEIEEVRAQLSNRPDLYLDTYLDKINNNIDSTLLFMLNSLTSKFNMPFTTSHNNEINQNVKIEATFPNVSNHSEIEEAFNNLVNEAAQYAYRKK